MGYEEALEQMADFHEEATIDALQAAMDEGRITAAELVHMYLHRIAKYNAEGPCINAVLEVNPDAMHTAEALLVERKLQGRRGPLHGIPVLLKDNIDTGDKMHTSAGSLALATSVAPRDSFVAAKLRHAGAVILGKVNMTEWANFMTNNMPNGYSSRGGQVRNPYGPGVFDVGGSSAGSGAAIAANFAVAAIGTETSGSILSPSSQNSLVGIKPTVGLVSRTGIIPIAHSQDTAGPMTRTVRDAAIVLGAITGIDEEDAATYSSRGMAHQDYTQFLNKDGLQGARIGVPGEYYRRLDEAKRNIVDRAIRDMQAMGAEIVDDIELSIPEDVWNYDVLVYEFKAGLNAYLAKLGPAAPVKSLRDVIAFNREHAAGALKYGQTILAESEATSGTLTESRYLTARLRDLYATRQNGIDKVMTDHRLDALLFANNWGAAAPAKAGYPSITVPAGYTPEGQPVGITFTGGAYSEPSLLALAYAYEQGTHHRVPPKL